MYYAIIYIYICDGYLFNPRQDRTIIYHYWGRILCSPSCLGCYMHIYIHMKLGLTETKMPVDSEGCFLRANTM